MPTIRPRTGPFWNVLLVVGSVFGALLLGEGLLAVLQPKPLRVNHRDFYEHDADLGWKKKANARRVNVTEEFRAVESTNSKGIRGGEYSYGKPPNEYRILVLGDSFAEGYSVAFEDLFSEILKSRLNNRSGKTTYEVINAATVGYGTDQELIFYKNEGYKYAPDLVIVLFYENDVIDNITRREIYGNYKPLFTIEENRLVLTKNAPPENAPDDRQKLAAGHASVDQWLKNLSRVYSLVTTAMTNWGLIAVQTPAPPEVPRDFRVLAREPDAEVARAWRVTEMLLVELKKTVEETGAQLLVLYAPSLHSVDSDVFEATRKKYGVTEDQWDALQVESDLMRICSNRGIDCIPTIARFKEDARSHGKAPSCFYFPRDAHWNSHGHKLVGEILADHIRSEIQGPLRAVPSSQPRSQAV